jgi:putative hemolysin
MVPTTAIVLFCAFAIASFFFALAETALFSLGKWQVRRLATESGGAGQIVQQLLAVPQDLLATIVLGNTFSNAGMVTVGMWMVFQESWPGLTVVLTVLLTILVFGEVIPKTLAVRAPEVWALQVALPIRAFQRGTRPFRQVAQRLIGMILGKVLRAPSDAQTSITAEDYAELVDLAAQQGTLGQSEKEIILQIINLDRRTAKEVMVPRAQVRSLRDDSPVEEMIEMARKFRHRRIPLYDETPDTIVGILNTRVLLLNPEVDLSEAIEFPSFVPESMNLLQLLNSLQRQKRGMAIVLDEYGGMAGMVTIENILGFMVGRVRDEEDGSGFVMERLSPGRWRVNGTMRIDDFRREFAAIGSFPEVETMGGLVVALAEQVPAQGAWVKFRGLKLTASIADERRVREVLVETARKGEVTP